MPRINANGIADAHELPARRQHQHREGSRRPAPAADLRSAGPRGEGRHQRLRAGVRPDDRAWSTTRSRRRAPTTSTARRASASSATRCRRSRSSSRRPRASPTPRPNDVTATLGGPIQKDKWHFFGAYEYVDRSLITGGQVITVDAGRRRRRSASRCRRAASSRRTRRSTSRSARPTTSCRPAACCRCATSCSRTSRRRTSAAG